MGRTQSGRGVRGFRLLQAILRLTKELAWTEEVLAAAPGLRSGAIESFADRVMANELDVAVARAAAAFEATQFREALKARAATRSSLQALREAGVA